MQNASKDTPDALAMLKQVCERYTHATYYHIESEEESQLKGEISRNWYKSLTKAYVAIGNRYLFETRETGGWWVQISDGKNEWVYDAYQQQYTQQLTPASGPTRFKTTQYIRAFQMNKAQDLLKDIARLPSFQASAVYLPDEVLELDGKPVTSMVIESQGTKIPNMPDVITRTTFWIDRDARLIRKILRHEEGALIGLQPHEHYVSERTTNYQVADLDVPSAPDNLFVFSAPSTAKLVKEFQDPIFANNRGPDFIGKIVPAINLKTAEGETVSLETFRGKPLLIDFWATWCGPCVDSMPSLEKIYRETNAKGLALLSVDEDDEAKTATDFLADHKEPWPNFHADEEIQKAFPHQGIPFVVLVDASGKIVFAKFGLNEEALRGAIAKLGPEFAGAVSAAKE